MNTNSSSKKVAGSNDNKGRLHFVYCALRIIYILDLDLQ